MKKETKRNIGIAGGVGATGLLAAGILNRKRISSHFRTLANGKKVPVKGKKAPSNNNTKKNTEEVQRRLEDLDRRNPSFAIQRKKKSRGEFETGPKLSRKQKAQNELLRSMPVQGRSISGFNNSFVGLIEFNRNYQGIRQQGRIDARQGTGKQGTRFGLKASKTLAQTSVDALRATGSYTRGRADVALNRAKKNLMGKFRNRNSK